ncbi:methyl-accepting chemotaxis protein [Brevibacillus fluminis]|uniref:methyl-accepting chemotaxis protein n=1 Tax=Brevibacillus fluminis TaxID=511487 RepID=UPI003F896E22
MMAKKSIRVQLIVPILLLLVLALVAVGTFGYLQAEKYVSASSYESAASKLNALQVSVNGKLAESARIVDSLASLTQLDYRFDQPGAFIDQHIKEWTNKYPAYNGFWFNYYPAPTNPVTKDSWYIQQNGQAVFNQTTFGDIRKYENDPAYDFFYGAKKSGTLHYTAPYYDPSNHVAMLSISKPIVRDNQEFAGVVGLDLDLNDIQKLVSSVKISEKSYNMLLAEDGTIIYHPDQTVMMTKNALKDFDAAQMAYFQRAVASKENLMQEAKENGQDRLLFSTKIPETNWTVLSSVPKEDVVGVLTSMMVWSAGICVAVILLATLLLIRLVSGTLKPIHSLLAGVNRISQDDLSTKIEVIRTGNEFETLAVAFQKMQGNLQAIVKKVSELTNQLSRSSEQLSQTVAQQKVASEQFTISIDEVTSGAQNQLRGAEESARVIEEMALGISRIAEATGEISEASLGTTKEAEAGNRSIQRAVAQMSSIREAVQHSADVVKLLETRSGEIGQIVELITGIASQTNLLALNAAIEAARAGEHGRGFAVVADEVRKLAEQSDASARQISSLIMEIQQETKSAMDAMASVNSNVQEGMSVIETAGQAFQRISKGIESVSGQIVEVSAVSEQMSASSEEVSASVDESATIAAISAQNAEHVATVSKDQLVSIEGLVSSVHSLNEMAMELKGLISRFRV